MRRTLEAVSRQDYQAVLGDLEPEVEIDDTDIPEATGTDSFLTWLARWDAVWDSWHIEDLEIRAADDEQVIALFRMVAKGRSSGIELTRPDALVASFRNGKTVRLGYYNDQAQALKAVGRSRGCLRRTWSSRGRALKASSPVRASLPGKTCSAGVPKAGTRKSNWMPPSHLRWISVGSTGEGCC